MVGRRLVIVSVVGALACGSATPTAPNDGTPTDSTGTVEQKGCARTSVGFPPLDNPRGSYHGLTGGLYGDGQTEPPGSHLAAGLQLARAIEPLDADGRASASGRYAFISIGMSNTTQEFSTFVPMANADPQKDPRLVVLDGAQGGVTAADWINPGCACWAELDRRLRAANVSNAQVVTAWIKLADRQPASTWPAYAQTLQRETETLLQMLKTRFPNLVLAYLSSRIYAGYATSTLNPEPYAYESGFAMRWVIEDQLNGRLPFAGAAAQTPWVGWGPYLWADGLQGRADGLTWACSDFVSDGTHPSTSGRQKVAQRLLEFVRSNATAREWYVGQ